MTAELERLRRHYAEEVALVAGVTSPGLVEAFARVPRENFLGPGPWQIPVPESFASSGDSEYRATPDADPARICHNVLVAIDRDRGLNNGQPSALALWISALDIRPGDRVVHIGAGVGYYTAILAELCGPTGSVTAFEVDVRLAALAKQNLAPWSQVTVQTGNSSTIAPDSDAVFVNAGCTRPRAEWLDSLRPGGRLVLPLTAARSTPSGAIGVMMKLHRTDAALDVSFISMVAIFHCEGARDAEEESVVLQFLRSHMAPKPPVCILLRDPHSAGPKCLLHTGTYCLSAKS
jgi:protein-L-isoaspartate(D-aspartate) O-methyltransferase